MRGWFVFVVPAARAAPTATRSIARAGAQGVQSKPYLPAIHLMSFYRERFGHREGVPGLRGRRRALDRAAVLPGDDRGRRSRGSPRRRRRAPATRCRTQPPRCRLPRAAAPRLPRAERARSPSTGACGHDVAQSRAHARMLAARRLSVRRTATPCGPASTRSRRARRGDVPVPRSDEDIHMAIERRLTEIVGRVGGTRHTARSRNDQVATDVALFIACRGRCDAAGGGADRGAARRRRAHLDWPMPGYTHLQRAQPVYLCHHLLAYVWMLAARPRALRARATPPRAASRRWRACRRELRHRPRAVAGELGFARSSPTRSTPSKPRLRPGPPRRRGDMRDHPPPRRRDLFWERGVRLREVSDAWTSGSSMMPQKKNPDAGESCARKAPRDRRPPAALRGVLHALR